MTVHLMMLFYGKDPSMEIIKINRSELKVMMSGEDMKKYSLDCDSLEENCPGGRLALKCILRDAKEDANFYNEGDHLLVRVFPSKGGGCEMFITKLSSKTDYNDKQISVTPSPLSEGIYIYTFSSLSDLAAACRRLYEAGYRASSSAYRDMSPKHSFYLVIGIKSPLPEEMGGRLMKLGTMYYINEYCTLFCHTAVDVLSKFA